MKLFQNELSKFFTLKYFNSIVDFLADMFTFIFFNRSNLPLSKTVEQLMEMKSIVSS